MKVLNLAKEFIFGDDRPFKSAHASTLAQLADGRILAAWFGGTQEKAPDTAIWVSVRSREGWEPCRCAADVSGVAMWNPVLFVKKDGTVLLFYKVGADTTEWKTWVVSSFDGGETWTRPRELVEGDQTGGRGPVKNKPIYLKNGNILAPASLEEETWDAFTDISEDEGVTWEKSSLVPLEREERGSGQSFGKGVIQPSLWQDDDGSVHMLLRSTASGIFRSDSMDNGRTWNKARRISLPNNNSGLDLVRLPEGGLVLACNPVGNRPDSYWGPRSPLVLFFSEDKGETWKELVTLEDGQGEFSYPAIICNCQHEIFVTYTWKRERIAFARISYESGNE